MVSLLQSLNMHREHFDSGTFYSPKFALCSCAVILITSPYSAIHGLTKIFLSFPLFPYTNELFVTVAYVNSVCITFELSFMKTTIDGPSGKPRRK